MGTYLGVKAVKEKGELFFEYSRKASLPKETRIIAILNNGVYEIAMDVTEESELTAAMNSGIFIVKRLYSLSEELVKECPDEGWVVV